MQIICDIIQANKLKKFVCLCCIIIYNAKRCFIISRDEKISSRLEQDYKTLEEMGYQVLGVFLYGSQNYKMDTDNSDIDTKAIIIPTFDNLVSKELTSKDIFLPDGGKIDVKDIRLMFENYLKQGINFVETIFTSHSKINEEYIGLFYGVVIKNRELIARYNPRKAVLSMYGNIKTKYKSLFLETPHSKEEIQKYGYSLKDFYHLARICEFLKRYAEGVEFYQDILIPVNTSELTRYKTEPMEIEHVKILADKMLKEAETITNAKVEEWKHLSPNEEIESILLDVQNKIIKHSLYRELIDNSANCEKFFR